MTASRATGGGTNPYMSQAVSPLVTSFADLIAARGANVLPRPAHTFTEGSFGPQPPLLPMPIDYPDPDGTVEPRRTQYPVAWNLPVGVPGSEGLGKLASFTTLRAMADKYTVVRSCIGRRIQEIIGLDWDIVPTKDAEEAMKGSDTKRTDWQKRHVEMMRFWERPDRSPESPYDNFEEWMIALLEDALVTDAVSLYYHPPLGGKGAGWFDSGLSSLDLIDGTTIRPLYSIGGGRPSPSAVAYQQFLWGVPRSDFASIAEGRDDEELPDYVDTFARSELMYRRTWPRSWSPYGFSAVEQALLPVAIGYARQTQQLEFYTEGSVPYLFVIPGNDLVQSPQQIRQLQNALNNIAGDTGWKQKIVVLPPGSSTNPIKPYDQSSQFDWYIAALVTMPFGLSPLDLGMIPNMGSSGAGFSSASARMAEQGQANAKDRWLEPFVNFWARQFNWVIQKVLGQTDMEWHWTGLEQGEDADDLIGQQTSLFGSSLTSVDEGRSEVGLDTYGEPWSQVPWVSTPGGMLPMPLVYEQATAQAAAGTIGQAPDPNAGDPNREDQRGAATGGETGHTAVTPAAHAAAGAVEDAKPAKPQSGQTGKSLAALLGEVELLGRLLRKGRSLESFEPRHLPPVVLEAVSVALPGGIDRALDAGRAAAVTAVVKYGQRAAGLIVKADDTGRVLMVQRAGDNHNEQAAGKWEWPGGGLDDNESSLDAAQREWEEEVGVGLPKGKIVGSWTSNDGCYTAFVYVIKREDDIDLSCADSTEAESVAWWDPADIVGNPAVRVEVQSSDWALIGSAKKAAIPDSDGVVPKGDARWPRAWHIEQEIDEQIVAYYQPLIAEALHAAMRGARGMTEAIRAARQATQGLPTFKTPNDPQDAISRLVLDAVSQYLQLALERLMQVLRRLWADAYLAGSHSAAIAGGTPTVSYLSPVDTAIDWATWTPGDPQAALQAAEGGLGRLLGEAALTIQGITGTLLERVGQAIADGIANGSTIDETAAGVMQVVEDPARAEMIARTETARAMAAAMFETYRQAGIEWWDWLDQPDACPICQSNAAGSPYRIGGGPPLPQHPCCRCTAAPVVNLGAAQ